VDAEAVARVLAVVPVFSALSDAERAHVGLVTYGSQLQVAYPRGFPAYLDPELATIALLGPIFYKRLMSAEPFEPERAAELVDTVLGPRP